MGNHLAATVAAGLLTAVLVALVRVGRHPRLAERDDTARVAPCLTADQLDAAIKRLTRRARVVGVVVLGLDGPASSFGEDVVLRAVAAVHGAVRASDFLARTADGFVVLLPGSSAGQAAQVARRMQEAVTASIDGTGALSASVGVSHGTGLDLLDVLRTAEDAFQRNRRRRAGHTVPV